MIVISDTSPDRRMVGPAGFLEGDDLLPGFRLPVADLFKGWDW